MRTLQEISTDELKRADYIAAVDRSRNMSLTIWGDDVVPPMMRPGAPAHESKAVEIDCGADDADMLNQIIERVKLVRGQVSSRVPNPPQLVLAQQPSIRSVGWPRTPDNDRIMKGSLARHRDC